MRAEATGWTVVAHTLEMSLVRSPTRRSKAVTLTESKGAPGPPRIRPPSCNMVPGMSRLLPALLIASALGAALLPATARAEAKVSQLIEQLKTSDDYRVRTQAALGLGASADDGAVRPLCDALSDSNVAVKAASAAALGKLGKPAGLPCLKAALARETAPAVKTLTQKAIATLEAAGSGRVAAPPPPPPAADAKFYVAIQITNKTARPAADVDADVRAAMQDKLLAKKGFAVAPKAETTAQGGQVVKSRKLKGFYLVATIEPPVYAGGDLSQVVRVSMWTYPDKALQGELAPKLTQSNTSKGDTQSEILLMKMCAENAIESFQKVAASL